MVFIRTLTIEIKLLFTAQVFLRDTLFTENGVGLFHKVCRAKSEQDTPAEVFKRMLAVGVALDLFDGAVTSFSGAVGFVVF